MVRKKGRSKAAKASAKGRLGIGQARKSKRASKKEDGDILDQQEKEIEKLKKQTAADLREKELARQPHTLVIHRGKVGKYVRALERDLRNIMAPNTALGLKIRKNNNIKDFLVNGAVLGVTNMMVLTLGDTSVQLRMMRFSQGPTLTFRVKQYSIARHILSAQKRPVIYEQLFQRLPLVVMNGFNKEKRHLQLAQTFIQNMFPSLNVDTINLRTVKRCLMVNYNEEDDTVDIRHYALRVVATGLSKSTKKILKAEKLTTKAVPDLSRYKDISDFFLNPGQLSESEFEGEQQEVELPQDINAKGGCITGQKSNVRLMEIGPRITLELLKIEEGIDEGEVLYHKYIDKSNEEILATRKKAQVLKKIKKQKEKDETHRIVRRLTAVKESQDREEAEVKTIVEKAARQQAAATGQAEDIENQREKDREIAMNREREEKQQEEGGGSYGFKRRGYRGDDDEDGDDSGKRFRRNSGGFRGGRGGGDFRGGRGGGDFRGGFRGRDSGGGDFRGGFRGRGGGGFRGRDGGDFRGGRGGGGFRGRDGGDFRGGRGGGGFRGRDGGGGFRGRDGGGGFRGRDGGGFGGGRGGGGFRGGRGGGDFRGGRGGGGFRGGRGGGGFRGGRGGDRGGRSLDYSR